jgi:streptomycin 6-kinase
MQPLPSRLVRNVAGAFGDAGIQWVERLPELVAECAGRWSLAVQPPLPNLSYTYIAPVRRRDGTAAILKLGVPNPELACEVEALRAYDGRGSVRLLEADARAGALLLERLVPGVPLVQVSDDEEATHVAARVMGHLWRPVPPTHRFPSVARWAAGLDRLRARFQGGSGPFPPALVDRAEKLFADLLASSGEPVLLHGDLHHENILRAQRQSWLAIDPKGVVGEPAYEVGALLRNVAPRLLEGQQPERVVARRVEILSEELGFDRTRLLGWGLAQAVLAAWWCIEDDVDGWEGFVRCAELVDEVME